MARQRRSEMTSDYLHVLNRGADRQDIFAGDGDRVVFESILAETVDRYGLQVHAYCLMSNHYHLAVRAPEGGISQPMQYFGSLYVRHFNRTTERDGPLCRSRFAAVDVNTDAQLMQLARYIHRNPLAFVPRGALAAYRWSSLGVYLGRRPRPAWLSTELVLGLHGDSAERLARFVDEAGADDLPNGQQRRPWRERCCEDVDRAVALALGCSPSDVRRATPRVRNGAREIAVMLAVQLRVATTSDLAQHYGYSDAAGVRCAARRARIRAARDDAFQRLASCLASDLATI